MCQTDIIKRIEERVACWTFLPVGECHVARMLFPVNFLCHVAMLQILVDIVVVN